MKGYIILKKQMMQIFFYSMENLNHIYINSHATLKELSKKLWTLGNQLCSHPVHPVGPSKLFI